MSRPTILAVLLFAALGYPAYAQSPAGHESHHPGQDQMLAAQQTACPPDQSNEQKGMMGMMGMMDQGMMNQGMMAHGMRGRTAMSGPMARPPVMFRMIFALMDADGDGAISLQEFQAAHERLFRAMDINKDGKLTPEEMRAFMHPGMGWSPQQ